MPRVGSKRSDRRWRAPDGTVWASKFEWAVYDSLKRSGYNIRRCGEGDTVSYTEPKANARCMVCGNRECVQDRTYTPDLFLSRDGGKKSDGYFIEVKGYFRREKRQLFRCLRNSRPDINLRLILEADHWVTKGKTRMSDYCERYLKTTPYHIWDGDIPEEWR